LDPGAWQDEIERSICQRRISGARLLRLTKYGLEPVTVKETDYYRVMHGCCDDPASFAEAAIE
jgi:hypothetical protein